MKIRPAYIPPLRYTHFGAYQIAPAVWFKEYRGQAAAFKTQPRMHPAAYRGPLNYGLFQQSLTFRPKYNSNIVSSNIPVKDIYGLQGYGEESLEDVQLDKIKEWANNQPQFTKTQHDKMTRDFIGALRNILYAESVYKLIEQDALHLLNLSRYSNLGVNDALRVLLGNEKFNHYYEVTNQAFRLRKKMLEAIQENTNAFNELPYDVAVIVAKFVEGNPFYEPPVPKNGMQGFGVTGAELFIILVGVVVFVIIPGMIAYNMIAPSLIEKSRISMRIQAEKTRQAEITKFNRLMSEAKKDPENATFYIKEARDNREYHKQVDDETKPDKDPLAYLSDFAVIGLIGGIIYASYKLWSGTSIGRSRKDSLDYIAEQTKIEESKARLAEARRKRESVEGRGKKGAPSGPAELTALFGDE